MDIRSIDKKVIKIKGLQNEIKNLQTGHEKEKFLIHVDDLFPHVKRLLKWEDNCQRIEQNKA